MFLAVCSACNGVSPVVYGYRQVTLVGYDRAWLLGEQIIHVGDVESAKRILLAEHDLVEGEEWLHIGTYCHVSDPNIGVLHKHLQVAAAMQHSNRAEHKCGTNAGSAVSVLHPCLGENLLRKFGVTPESHLMTRPF